MHESKKIMIGTVSLFWRICKSSNCFNHFERLLRNCISKTQRGSSPLFIYLWPLTLTLLLANESTFHWSFLQLRDTFFVSICWKAVDFAALSTCRSLILKLSSVLSPPAMQYEERKMSEDESMMSTTATTSTVALALEPEAILALAVVAVAVLALHAAVAVLLPVASAVTVTSAVDVAALTLGF